MPHMLRTLAYEFAPTSDENIVAIDEIINQL